MKPVFPFNNTFSIRVIPNAPKSVLKEENGRWKLYLHAAPEQGKANTELVKFFKKEFHLNVEIISGLRSREKLIAVLS